MLCRCNETAISLKAGCQLFLRYTTRTSALEMEDFEAAKAFIIEVCSAASLSSGCYCHLRAHWACIKQDITLAVFGDLAL